MSLNNSYKAWKENPTEDTKNQFGKDLMSYCEALCRDDGNENQDDVIGDAVLKVWEALPSFQGKSSFATWAKTVIFNAARDEYRKMKARNEEELVEVSDEGLFVEDIDNRILLQQLVSKLDKSDQIIVGLKLEDLTEYEIAEKLGIPEGTLSARWSRVILPKLQQLAK